MRLHSFLAAVLLAAFCIAGRAACDTGLAERMHAKLHPERQLDHERAVCEPWRGVPGRFIVVLPLPRPSSRPDSAEFDLDVLVVQQADNGNTERAKIVSRLFEPAALTEDAVRISAIKVDSARYVLGPAARAFGLRILHQGSSRAHPYSNETLTLYLPQGPKLAKVLDKFETVMELGEWDTSCEGNFETIHSSLALAHSASEGLADLSVRETRTESHSVLQGEECVTQEKPARFKSALLRYDGTRYRLAKNIARND
jgi:hypothetical protein